MFFVFLIAERICGVTAIDCFVGKNNRVCSSLEANGLDITHPSELQFTTDTVTVTIVLQSNYFGINTEEQELTQSSGSVMAAQCQPGYPPWKWGLKEVCFVQLADNTHTPDMKDSVLSTVCNNGSIWTLKTTFHE